MLSYKPCIYFLADNQPSICDTLSTTFVLQQNFCFAISPRFCNTRRWLLKGFYLMGGFLSRRSRGCRYWIFFFGGSHDWVKIVVVVDDVIAGIESFFPVPIIACRLNLRLRSALLLLLNFDVLGESNSARSTFVQKYNSCSWIEYLPNETNPPFSILLYLLLHWCWKELRPKLVTHSLTRHSIDR